MATHLKSKEIQVQKPAQSLQAFQQKLAQGPDVQSTLLKPVLIATGAVLIGALLFFGVRGYRASQLEKHEAALAKIIAQVEGEAGKPLAAGEKEKRMREQLPHLEKLAAEAPSASKAVTQGMLATWKLELDGQSGAVAAPETPWERLVVAQRQVALGKSEEAHKLLASLKSNANPGTPWAPVYWTTLMETHRLASNRAQAWKDYAEYKERFKAQADPAIEKMMASI